MTKQDFILAFLANQMSPFTNRIALSQNVKDMIQLAELIYTEAQAQLEIKQPEAIKPVQKKRQA